MITVQLLSMAICLFHSINRSTVFRAARIALAVAGLTRPHRSPETGLIFDL